MVTSNDCLKKYGEASASNKNLVLFDIYGTGKIPTLPKRIFCNIDLRMPLAMALDNVVKRNLQEQIVTWDGCFNIRNKRGLGSLSLHSWAIAIDINATWNQLGKEPTMSKELVQCFKDAGFDWGGDWKRKDGMHFQLAKI